MREKLIELLANIRTKQTYCTSDGEPVTTIISRAVDEEVIGIVADALLADGWIRPPCKVGQEVWVPVTERLPEDGVRVLALHDDGVVRIGISRGYFPAVVTKSHTKTFGFAEVTHWMPLPQPPKEGE